MAVREIKPRVIGTRFLAQSWKIALSEDTLRYGKKPPFHYARISLPDVVLAVATRKEEVALVRQYRHGAGRVFWEFPAGMMEEEEDPVECVKREFCEETGFELNAPKLVSSVYVSPSRSSQVTYIFRGEVGSRARQKLDANERLSVKFVPVGSVRSMLSKPPSTVNLLASVLALPDKYSRWG